MTGRYTIPINLIELDNHSFHVMVEAYVNDIPLNLVIDTGASRTVLDKESMKGIIYKADHPGDCMKSSGIMADDISSSSALAGKFRMGKLVIEDLPVLLIDMKKIKLLYFNVTGTKIHGLLGSDFLLKMKSTIDYRKMQLILTAGNTK